MKETMQTYSECLVHHLGPQALWRGDFLQQLTTSPPSLRCPHTQTRALRSRLFLDYPERNYMPYFPKGSREICVLWYYRNNSDNSRIYQWMPFSLFTRVSSYHFSPPFFHPIPCPPLPKSPMHFSLHLVFLWLLHRIGKAASCSRWEVVSMQSLPWLSCLLCLDPEAQTQSEDLEEFAITIS